MAIEFKDSDVALSVAIRRTIEAIQGEQITLRQLLELIGEQGLLLFCIILTLPFLLPVSVPGVSTVFGLVIILIGIGVTLNRVPWLPARLMNHVLTTTNLIQLLEGAANTSERMEHWIKPRLSGLTNGVMINRINGLSLILGGILLLFPLGLVPFSNTLPALAVLFMAVGILQRDGVFVLAGYAFNVFTILYFSALALAVIIGGQTLL